MKIRLDKYLADSGFGTRSEVKLLVKSGSISLNGNIVKDSGIKIDTENDEIQAAADCREYEEGTPDCLDDGHRTTSATGGDYGPSSPWDAPGMSVRDFI